MNGTSSQVNRKQASAAKVSHSNRQAVVSDHHGEASSELASRVGVGIFMLVVFVVFFAAVCGIWFAFAQEITLLTLAGAVALGLLALNMIHIAQQWERVVVLRLGKFSRVAGPGIFFTIPLIESCTLRVDTRIRTTMFGAEETLTSDLVPLNVDAVLFWHVWDAKFACTEVNDFARAISLAAQAALRDAIGRASVAEVAIRRQQLDRELKGVLDEKAGPWGITVLSVELRDIKVPKELQDVMSLEAQAEQRKKARIILMEAEQDISEMLTEMGSSYAAHEHALKIRTMHLLYESVRETGGTVVIPSDYTDAFKDIDAEEIKKLFQ